MNFLGQAWLGNEVGSASRELVIRGKPAVPEKINNYHQAIIYLKMILVKYIQIQLGIIICKNSIECLFATLLYAKCAFLFEFYDKFFSETLLFFAPCSTS